MIVARQFIAWYRVPNGPVPLGTVRFCSNQLSKLTFSDGSDQKTVVSEVHRRMRPLPLRECSRPQAKFAGKA
jgi:hypothetical protein